jgi:2,3-bisphosphoglycerate-dependent phosphoglycerate mutase
MPLTRLILVRHAKSLPDPARPEPEWPLSDLGRQQALQLVPVLSEAGVNRLVSSPYVRAMETLRPFAEAVECPIEVHPDLRERRLTAAWIDDLEPELLRMHADLAYAWPDGETGHEAAQRMSAALLQIGRQRPGACVAVATHGAIICHLLRSLGADLDPDYWRRVRNPHLFEFELDRTLAWTGEHVLDGSRGVRLGTFQ